MVVLDEVNELARALIEGDHKKAIAIIKSVLEESRFKDKYVELAWQGWLMGLEKLNPSSLITTLMNGVSAENAKRFANYLDSLAKTLSVNIPDKAGFAKGFLKSWVNLLEAYVSLIKNSTS